MTVRNTGDVLTSGSITYNVIIQEYNGSTWVQLPVYDQSANISGINLNTCNTYTYGTTLTMGFNGHYVSLNTRTYKAVITSPNVSGSKESNILTGFNNPGFNCNVGASFSISASSNPTCAGNSVTFTAGSFVNQGATPSFQWYVGSTPVGGNSTTYTYTPTNGDVISCWMTSSLGYVNPNPVQCSSNITMTVNALNPVSVSVGASANPVCVGTSVTFTATPTNGGTTPFYQWYKGASPVGTNSTTYSYVPVNGDTIKCVMTSNISCPTGNPATSNTITMTVNALPVPTISGPSVPCHNKNITYTTEAGMSNYVWTWSISAGGSYISGGGTSDNTITLKFATAGSITGYVRVSYTNTNGCTSSTYTEKTITSVNTTPNANAIANPNPVYVGNPVQIYDLVLINPGDTFSWTGPNGFSSAQLQPPAFISSYAAAGTYTVTASYASTGCQNTSSVDLSVIDHYTTVDPGSCGFNNWYTPQVTYPSEQAGQIYCTQTVEYSTGNVWVATTTFSWIYLTAVSNCTTDSGNKIVTGTGIGTVATFKVEVSQNMDSPGWGTRNGGVSITSYSPYSSGFSVMQSES
jgi:hypothetical protein